ncbi:MAG: VOC family protein [Myxococcota bacterium]
MHHAFVHFELNTSAPAEVRRFYDALFDWTFEDVDMGEGGRYTRIQTPSGPAGGLQPNAMPAAPAQWVPYVGVEDVKAMLERVREAGGEVVVEYTPVPGFGALAIVQDPGGTQLGLWEVELPEEDEPEEAEPEEDEPEMEAAADGGEADADDLDGDDDQAVEAVEASSEARSEGLGAASQEDEFVQGEPEAEMRTTKKAVAKKKAAKKTAKKATAKKATTKKATTKKAPAKKTAKKAAAKKSTAKKTAKKAATKKAPAKKTAKKAAAKKAPAKKTSKRAAAKKTPGKKKATRKSTKRSGR